MKRREFIESSLFATAGTMFVPAFLKDIEQITKGKNPTQAKVLVIIQFSGGNDGLNTVIPFKNDIYYQERPKLAIPETEVLKLNDEMGVHPSFAGLRNLYNQGELAIINSVGYPNPNRSHFRSMDIWHTASDSDKYLQTGWLGRYLDANCSNQNCSEAHQVIEVDDTLNLAVKGQNIKGIAVQNPQKLYRQVQGKGMQAFSGLQTEHSEESNVAYLYKTLAETVSSAEYIYESAKTYQNTAEYPQNRLAKDLKTVASLIAAGLSTRVYYLSVGGFDTHVNQAPTQKRLLEGYDQAVSAFIKDLKAQNRWGEVTIMTFSEFGRRVAQNASGGTDHGTANSVFLMGKDLKKAGFYNGSPNLTDLDKGDLKFAIDFRRIYADLLEKTLEVNAKNILGQSFEPLGVV